jgi:hypothetical protein
VLPRFYPTEPREATVADRRAHRTVHDLLISDNKAERTVVTQDWPSDCWGSATNPDADPRRSHHA